MNSLINKVENKLNLMNLIKKYYLEDKIPFILFGKDDVSNITYNILKNEGVIVTQQCNEEDFEKQTNMFNLVNVIVTNREPKKSREFLEKKKNINEIFFYDALPQYLYKLTYEEFFENIQEYEKVYNLFEDDISKEVFVAFLNAKISGDYTYTQGIETWGQYVEKGIVDFKNIQIIADCGSFKGEDIIKFSNMKNETYERIIAFEPNKSNFNDIKKNIKEKNISNVSNIDIYNIATWNKEEVLNFEDNTIESWSCVSNKGKNKVQANTIDNILKGAKCDYIKMDVEGAEYNSLLGAKETILKYRPDLAISVYHTKSDFLNIPNLINSYCSEYNFYLRNYSKFAMECIFYAVKK